MSFGIIAVSGAVETFLLFRYDPAVTLTSYGRIAPFVGFGGMALLSLSLIASSRPVVVHRDTGPLGQRIVLQIQRFGQLATLHGIAAIIFVVPAFIAANKFVDPASNAVKDVPAKPTASAAAAPPMPGASASNSTPGDRPLPPLPSSGQSLPSPAPVTSSLTTKTR